jgi:hypothetical protein
MVGLEGLRGSKQVLFSIVYYFLWIPNEFRIEMRLYATSDWSLMYFDTSRRISLTYWKLEIDHWCENVKVKHSEFVLPGCKQLLNHSSTGFSRVLRTECTNVRRHSLITLVWFRSELLNGFRWYLDLPLEVVGTGGLPEQSLYYGPIRMRFLAQVHWG